MATREDRPNVPEWLSALGVKEGEYFIDSKLRAKRAMKSACFSGPARIHIYLGLATMGFQQELAVKLEAGKKVPVQPVDICAATGIHKGNFRRFMNCLEAMGLAKCEPSTKGRFLVYGYAVPREVVAERIVVRATTIVGCSPDLNSFLNRYRIRLPDVVRAHDIEELERLARTAKEAVLVLRAYAKGLNAQPVYKEERNERHIERKEPPPPQPSVSSAPPDEPKAEEEDALFQKFKEAYPKEHFDEPKAKPAFRKLTVAERQRAVTRLLFPFLSCPRWLDHGGRWIPFASNFLKDHYYDGEPPPAFQTAKAGTKLASFEDVAPFMGKPEWQT